MTMKPLANNSNYYATLKSLIKCDNYLMRNREIALDDAKENTKLFNLLKVLEELKGSSV